LVYKIFHLKLCDTHNEDKQITDNSTTGDDHNLRDPFANTTLVAGDLTSAFFAALFSYDGWDILNFGAGFLLFR
jgi:hypothetical protein